jgi:hypothetical protein
MLQNAKSIKYQLLNMQTGHLQNKMCVVPPAINSGLSAFFISQLFCQSLIDKKENKLYS